MFSECRLLYFFLEWAADTKQMTINQTFVNCKLYLKDDLLTDHINVSIAQNVVRMPIFVTNYCP